MKNNILMFFLIALIPAMLFVSARDSGRKKNDRNKTDQNKSGSNDKGTGQQNLINPDFNLENNDMVFFGRELLGRPTDSSVTIKVIPNKDVEIFFEYGKKSKEYSNRTEIFKSSHLNPVEAVFKNLEPDTEYFYRMNYRLKNKQEFTSNEEHYFHTRRKQGNKFVFTVSADPHLDNKTDPELYKKVMISALSKAPDFHIDLGDNFMSDKLIDKTENNVIKRHLELRGYFDLLCHSAPLFLVIGNHEGELGWNYSKGSDGIAFWALSARKSFYLNPEPDNFYTGDNAELEKAGLYEDYYSWEWGDALFVVIDPYWFTLSKPRIDNENWKWTLGYEQYQWLKAALEKSRVKFKFVFSHQLVGGSNDGRGGVEFVKYFEQGGYNKDGTWGFDSHRPGWGKTINQLMKDNGVNIFFHGHDHLYAKQEYDGIIYQCVPQPGNDNFQTPPYASEYGYHQGTILGNSGYLKITVSESEAIIDFIQLQKNRKTGEIFEITADSYKIKNIK